MRIMQTSHKDGLETTHWYGFSDSSHIECMQHAMFVQFMLNNSEAYNNDDGTISAFYNIAVNDYLKFENNN